MFSFDWFEFRLTILLPAIVLALTVHEYAHARVAYVFGDTTAKNAGRLTLNPLAHLDVVGSLMLIFAGIGWAKPVPVNPYYFRGSRKQKMLWVALAGPLSNLAQALIVSVLLSILIHFGPMGYTSFLSWLHSFLYFYVSINILLAVFNLLPIPPLDGSKVLAGLLPTRHMNIIFALERYGFIIIIVLALSGVLFDIIVPIRSIILNAMMRLVGLGYLAGF